MNNLFDWPDYVGEIGKMLDVMAKFLERIEFDPSAYNLFLYRFKSGKNFLVWFTNQSREFEVGRMYRVSGIVVRHKPYNGIPQTVLKRCRITNQS